MSVSGSTSAFAGAKNLGSCPLQVSRMGYGAWPLSYAERPDEATALAVLHRALDNGVRFIDTSDAYCKDESEKHHNERLIRKALASYPDQTAAQQVVVATKGICVRPEGRWERCATPEQIKKAIAGSHEALCGKEKPIDLWQIHWCQVQNGNHPDDKLVPLETLLAPVTEAIGAGIVSYVGLSNCDLEQIKAAQACLPPGRLVSVQNRYNMWDRSSERLGVLEYCQAEGLAFLPWSPLGGRSNSGDKGLLREVEHFPNLNRIAAAKGIGPERLALAAMVAKWPCITHITSARQEAHLLDSLASVDVEVTAAELEQIYAEGDQGEGEPPWQK